MQWLRRLGAALRHYAPTQKNKGPTPVGAIDNNHVGFDNERGKGDHCHLDGKQLPYEFTILEMLIEDFIREVDKRRK